MRGFELVLLAMAGLVPVILLDTLMLPVEPRVAVLRADART